MQTNHVLVCQVKNEKIDLTSVITSVNISNAKSKEKFKCQTKFPSSNYGDPNDSSPLSFIWKSFSLATSQDNQLHNQLIPQNRCQFQIQLGSK